MVTSPQDSSLVLILAPLRGVTGAAFRTVWSRHFEGFDSALAPFIPTTKGARTTLRHYKDILPQNNTTLRVTPQLIGNNPEDFINAGIRLAQLGYDCINWNLGCPSPTVTRKDRGSALLSQPDRIRSFLDTTLARFPCRLSVKTRLGFENPYELLGLLPALNQYPLDEVIVHPRTGSQMFGGVIDLDRFEQVLGLSTHPVVFNGDVISVERFASLRERFPTVSAWMIGRGAIADPFLPARIKKLPLPLGPVARITAFHDELYAVYRAELSGPAPLLGKMKEMWEYLVCGFGQPERNLRRIRRCKTLADYERVVEKIFGAARSARSVDHAEGG